MNEDRQIARALFLIRITIGAFFAVWASLKFYRPEWMAKICQEAYGLPFITKDHSFTLGIAQMAIVIFFILGLKRTFSYGLIVAMHCVGVAASIPHLIKFTHYPSNLLWTAVPTLGAAIALFLLRKYDIYSIDGWLGKRR